jgi:hypothetical protein
MEFWVLPAELKPVIFSFLSIFDILTVRSTNSEFHKLSQESSVWESAFRERGKFAKLSSSPILHDEVQKKWLFDFIRFDGVYISRCKYNRVIPPGHSFTDNRGYVEITFFRILRLFKNGSAYMLTTPAENDNGVLKVPRKILQSLTASSIDNEDARYGNWWVKDATELFFEFSDSSHQWTAIFYIEKKKLVWNRYFYFDPIQVNSEKQKRLNQRHQMIQEAISDADESRLLNLLASDDPNPHTVLSEYPELIENLRLTIEHFPELKFKPIRYLAYLF